MTEGIVNFKDSDCDDETLLFLVTSFTCFELYLYYLFNPLNLSFKISHAFIMEHLMSNLADLYTPLSPKIFWHVQGNGELGKLKNDDLLSGEFVAVVRQDYFI